MNRGVKCDSDPDYRAPISNYLLCTIQCFYQQGHSSGSVHYDVPQSAYLLSCLILNIFSPSSVWSIPHMQVILHHIMIMKCQQQLQHSINTVCDMHSKSVHTQHRHIHQEGSLSQNPHNS